MGLDPAGATADPPKKKKQSYIAYCDDGSQLEFHSPEEVDFFYWCEEALKYQYLAGFRRAKTIQLAPPVQLAVQYYVDKNTKKLKKLLRTVLKETVYTADFEISISQKFYDEFMSGPSDEARALQFDLMYATHPDDYNPEKGMLIDIKGDYVLQDRLAEFNLRRKMCYLMTKRYVRQVEVKKWFLMTWAPLKAAYTAKTEKRRTKYMQCRLLHSKTKLGVGMGFMEKDSSILPDMSGFGEEPR